ncbi:MAG: TolC family protein [Bacteroidales bacterium]
MNRITTFSSIILFGLAGLLDAQNQTYTLTLDQAREYAVQNNKNLLNARDQVTSANEKIRETKAQGLPQVNGSMDYMTYFNYEMNFSFGSSGEPIPPDVTSFDAGDYAMLDYLANMFGSSEPIIMTDQLSGKVQVSQLIYSGQYWAGIQVAKIARDLTSKNVTRSELDVKEYVANSYFLILITEQNLRIIKENIANLDATIAHTTNMFKAGVAEQTDVDQLKVALSQLKNTQKSVERAIQLSYNMLKFQLGVAPDAKIILADSFETILGKLNPEKTLATEYDISNNINYSLAQSQVRLSQAMLGMQNWAYSPTIAGFYSYTKKIITTGFDLNPNHLAGVSLTIPIFTSGMRMAKVNQSKIDLDIAMRNQEMIKEQLETQQSQLLFNLQNAVENYATQKENVEIAGRVYTSIENKYKQGLVSSLDLTQASGNLLNAENNYLSSVLTLLQAQTALDKLYNNI